VDPVVTVAGAADDLDHVVDRFDGPVERLPGPRRGQSGHLLGARRFA
jgi:hypothetical protein